MQEKVVETLYTNIQKITQEPGLRRAETSRTDKELVPINQKLKGLEGNAISEATKSAGALIQNYTEAAERNRNMDRTKIPKMPYLGGGMGPKVGYQGERSKSLHPGLDKGGDGRKLGVKGGGTEPKRH